jgi:transposase
VARSTNTITDAETSDLPPFQAMAQGFRHDYEPINAALPLPWRTGQCEGQICREIPQTPGMLEQYCGKGIDQAVA